jgi:putative NADPH-quinone reductase
MKILIILGHPAKKRQSLSEALANAYKEGAIESGHEVCLYKVADKQFDPILHEGYGEEQTVEPDIAEAQEKIRWADHLVFVYPLWEYMIPALLKGFLERTLTRGFAWLGRDSKEKGKLLAGKSARLIQTSGMPAFIYRFCYRAHGMNALRDLLGFCGIKPVHASCFGMIETADDTRRKQWLNKMKILGSKGG